MTTPVPLMDPEFMALATGLDAAAFWREDALCGDATEAKPRCRLTFSPDDHWLFEFLGVESTVRYYHDKAFRDALHRQANDLTRRHIGKAFFAEDTWQHSPKRIENLFGCEFSYVERGTPWLTPATGDPDAFARILDQAEATDLRAWALPEPFLAEWEARRAAGRPLPVLGGGSRGPATIITSVLHVEDAFFWIEDHPGLMDRFTAVLARKMVELNTVLRDFSGNTEPGWWITDDNCALFNRPLYQRHCVPVLEALLAAMAPPPARRHQHSDSDMAHLLPDQLALGINEVNYGPGIDVATIRAALPEAVILGHLPPFLLRNGTPEAIRQRVIDDFRKAGAGGRLVVTTAGSTAAGTGIGRMRWLMRCVGQCCRYDGAASQPAP